MLRRRNRKTIRPATLVLDPASFPPVYAKPRPATFEPLERRVLLSVSSSSLAGPQTVGFQRVYEEIFDGTVDGTTTETIAAVGTASFNGAGGLTEYDDNDGLGSMTQNFISISNTNGVKNYGGITTNSTGSATTTFSPAYVSIPATLTAGTTYTAVYTGTVVTSGANSTTNSGVFNYSVELASDSTQSITVPAGTFNCYQINVSITATVNGVTETPTNSTDYFAASIGKVESTNISTTGSGSNITHNTSMEELTGSSIATLTPSQLAFTGAPDTEIVGLPSATPFTVAVEDADGNTVATDSSEVTVALTAPDGATLGGTTAVAAVSGIATFSDLTVDQTGTYTLTATDGTLTSALSPSFTVVNATPNFATLTNGALTVMGTAGNDTISLTTSGSTLTATLNGVALNFPLASVTSIDVEGEAGDDLITLGDGIIGSSVQGGPGDDTIMGGPGNDTIGGGAGNDSLSGGPGDDSIKGGAGDDLLAGGKGNDTLLGGLGNDTLRGALGDDSLNGGAGTNQLYGGQGNNVFYCVNGTDDQIFVGAATNDSLIYSPSDNYIIESGTIPPGNITLA